MTYLHMQFQPYTYIQTKVTERKLKISSRGITQSVINHQTTTKFKLDLHNPMTYPYIKFELNVCNPYRYNERKLKISIFFFFFVQKPADQNQIRTWPTHSYDEPTHIHASKQKLDSINWKFHFFSKFKRGNSVKNQWTITKFELDLRIPLTNLHMQFEPYTYMIHPNKS
jgi:hypothetical protein